MKKIVGMLVCLFVGSANATIILGDFRTESDLDFGAGPKVYEDIAEMVGGQVELTSSDFVSNPQGWGGGLVNVDLDPISNILTLDSQDTWDFHFFDMWITNITFNLPEVISGISLISFCSEFNLVFNVNQSLIELTKICLLSLLILAMS